MPKQLNVNLAFTADTSQAKAQITQLQQSLDKLLSNSMQKGMLTGFDKEISNAQQSVLKLKTVLDNSLNADTGRLDLSKFNMQLNSSGLSLGKLATDMNALGSEGQKAFLNLANNIVTAQKPIAETNKLLDGMWTALKNTARWQLSSSLLHGFIGAIQGAYGYAQSLDKSLTNIAIVTGRSRDEMAAFAEQANKSAQALSTSTTAYTDAALIYYQQGLGDADVQARTDATVKLANVTGQSAEQISSYMTAIWNNFEDGSHTMEYYADVITALGAHTASSSEEIARGMQQFASVADTVGLSYEYAASALATIVAQTRQSETSVGNGLRTIFARLDSLKMGDTLDDGVTLTKYTAALEAAGVSVLDQNGKLKDMNTILDAIGEKWQTLDETQKAALATTIGGVRQYSNLMALFDHWDEFQENVNIAKDSEGTLQSQADTYAQSWEAAQKRVRAAWQAIYQDLIKSDFFILMLNGVEKVLKGVDGLIDALGGLPGVLSGISVLITTLFNKQIVAGLQNAQQQLKVFSGTAQAESNAMSLWVSQNLNKMKPEGDISTSVESLGVDYEKQRLALVLELREVYDGLTNAQKQYADNLLRSIENQQKLTLEAKQTAEAARTASDNAMRSLKNSAMASTNKNEMFSFLNQFRQDNGQFGGDTTRFTRGINEILKADSVEKQEAAYNKLYAAMLKVSDHSKEQAKLIEEVINKTLEAARADEQFANAQDKVDNETEQFSQRLQELIQGHHNGYTSTNELIQAIDNEIDSLKNAQGAIDTTNQKYKELIAMKQALQQSNQGIFGANFAQNITNSFKGVSQLTMGINSLKSAFDALGNQDLSVFEKITRFASGVSFGGPALMMGGKQAGKDIAGLFSGIQNYFNQKGSNQILDQMIGNNLEEMEKLKSYMGGNDAVAEAMTQRFNELANANAALNAGIKGGLTPWEDLIAVFKNAGTGILGFLKSAAPFLAWAAAAAAAVWVLKKAWDAWFATTPEGKLKAANEALEEAQKKAQETADAYKNVTSTLEEYANAKKRIAGMDSNTDRAEAIAEENNKILELIDSVDAWDKIGKLEYDDNGLINLSQAQQSILKNDAAREASLAKQAEYQAKINQLTAQSDKDYKDEYSGKKINLSRADGTYTETETSNGTVKTANYTNTDITREIASILNQNGLGLGDKDEIEQALVDSGRYTADEIANVILPALEAIRNNSEEAKEFNELQTSVAGDDAAIQAYQEQNARNALGSELDNVALDEAQNALIQVFNTLSDEEQQSISEMIMAGSSLTEAWTEAADIIAQANENTRNDLIEKISSNSAGNDEGEVSKWVNGLDEEQLKIAAKLDIDYDDSLEEIREKFAEELNSTPVEFDTSGLTKKQAAEAEEEFASLTQYIQENAEAIDELDDHLATCTREASQVAKAIMRFDDAIQDVTENYDDWNRALTSGSMQEAAKAAKGLEKAYKNLLDIDGVDLSSEFLESADNLELMKQAIEGNEDAYNELQALMGQDILAQVGLDKSRYESDKADIISDIENFTGQDWGDIEVGADLNDQAFLDKLSDLVTNAGMSAEQATAYLASMGIDAEVVKVPAETTEVPMTETVWKPYEYTTKPIETGGEEQGAGTYKALQRIEGSGGWESVPSSSTQQSSPSAFSLKVTSAHKSSGGGMKFRNASSGGGAAPKKGGGSGCFAAGTLVTVDNHYENIENIKVGDIVLSYNEKTKKNEFSEVLQTMIHFIYEKIYTLFIETEELVVTGNHRFYITRNNEAKWIAAEELYPGDLVFFADGTLHEISNIKTKVRFLNVYNFEVSNTHNYYVGENKILAHNKGGGGGGGSGKKKEVKEKPKDEDRYHDLKERIADLNTELKRLDKNKDRAFGKSKLKYMDQEIAKTEQQIALTKEYIAAIEDYMKKDRAALAGLDMGANFNPEGMLTNYEEVLKNINATYGAAIDAYNESAQEEADKEMLEAAQKKYEEAKKILAQYEKTYNLWQEQNQELIDQINNLYDKKVAKIQFQVELELEFDEEDRKLLEWLFDNLGDSADYAADKIANLNQQLATFEHDYDSAKQGLADLFAGHGITLDWDNMDPDQIVNQLQSYMKNNNLASEITEDEAKLIREWTSQMLDSYTSMREASKEVHEAVLDSMDDWLDRTESLTQKYDVLTDTLTHYKDIIDLTGKRALKMSSKELKELDQMIVNVDKDRLANSKLMYETLAEETAQAKANMEYFYSQGLTAEGDAWKEIYDDWLEKTYDALDEYQSAWKQAMDDNEEAFERALDEMVDAYNHSFGKMDLDWLAEQFERQSELDELYLPDYKKFHELNKSTNELEKSLKNTNNALIKGKMNDLLDDINAKMVSGAQVSEYETEIIARRVALLQAEAELENAKNAKKAVRMTRDNEGNFSYTYTADADAIDNAQENYGDKFYELLDYERQSQNEVQSMMLQKEQEYINAVKDAYEKYKDDKVRLNEALKKIDEDYSQWMNYFADQDRMLMEEMARLRDEDWQDFERIRDLKLASIEDFITNWEDTIIGRLEPSYKTAEEFLENWMFAEQTALDDSSIAHETWEMNLEDIMIEAGTSMEDFRSKVERELGLVQDKSEETRKAVENMVDDPDKGMKKKLQDAIDAAKNFDDKYGGYMKSIQDQSAKARAALDEVLKKLNETYEAQKRVAEQARETAAAIAAANEAAAAAGSGGGGGGGGSGGGGSGNPSSTAPSGHSPNVSGSRTETRYYLTSTGVEYSTSGQATSIGSSRGGWLYKRTYVNGVLTGQTLMTKFNLNGVISGGSSGGNMSIYDTGGYTGNWNTTDGKIAVLHQKELVLNEDDTKNVLNVVDIVRKIFGPNTPTMNNTINYTPLAAAAASGAMEQQVHIDASFPNVQSHTEIETALNNLINSASQYVNRKS